MLTFKNGAPGPKALRVHGEDMPVIIQPGRQKTADFEPVSDELAAALKAEGCTFRAAKPAKPEPAESGEPA